jgi:transcriptional regulator with XRE-family HTH domain
VADRMGRDKAAVSNFERLSADPHLSTIRRYAAAIGAMVTHTVENFEAPFGQQSHVGSSGAPGTFRPIRSTGADAEPPGENTQGSLPSSIELVSP